MSRSQRPRKAYRPKGINPAAHLMAMQGARCLSVQDAAVRAARVSLAVEDAARGVATQAQWRELFDAVNMAEAWAMQRVAVGMESVEHLQATIAGVLDRQRDTGTRALRAAELAALRDFAADYAGLLSGVTHAEYYRAQVLVETRTRRILAGERIAAGRVIDGAHLEVQGAAA